MGRKNKEEKGKILVSSGGVEDNKNVEPFVTYVIDFEGSVTAGVLEYGWVGLDSIHGIFSAETAFCKNRTDIPASESALHQIYAQQVSDCPDFMTVLPRLMDLRALYFFCAHQAAFENTLLQLYCPVILKARSILDNPQPSWSPWIDTCILYKKYFQKMCGKRSSACENSVTLQALIELCGLSKILQQVGDRFCPPARRHYHCALWDALACALLLLHFIRQEEIQTKTLTWLLQESSSLPKAQQLRQPPLFPKATSHET